MSRRRNKAAFAVGLTLLSAGAALLIKKRQDVSREHVSLYFEDGSMMSLPESSPQAFALFELGREVAEVATGSSSTP